MSSERNRTPIQQRAVAREMRKLVRIQDPKTSVADAAAAHGVARAHYYRLVHELEQWEETHTFQQEADEVNAMYPAYDPDKWILVSGNLFVAYCHRDGVSRELLNGPKDGKQSISVEQDSLLD